MLWTYYYDSPLGLIELIADADYLLEAHFSDKKCHEKKNSEVKSPILYQAINWLDAYFNGQTDVELPNLKIDGTLFQQSVLKASLKIPFGTTLSYGQLAKQVDCLSAQSVGGALGRNKLLIFIPCHRIVGVNGQLTGYLGGIDKKEWLIKHEIQELKK